ncbi:MAG: competence type IV pilus major pilin ComGC [Culicoidibacterales bacterium]
MRKIYKKRLGAFTLIEMLIVLLIISVLLMLIVPNIIKQQASINKKGCEAYVTVVESQSQIYQLEHSGMKPSIDTLYQEQYIKSKTCPDGSAISIDGSGHVQKA